MSVGWETDQKHCPTSNSEHRSIRSTYHDVLTFDLQTAGLTPINATLAQDGIIRLVFWFDLPNFIPNSKYVVPIDPIYCSGSGCNAYYAPGGLEDNLLKNYTNPAIPLEFYSDADAYVQKDAPGCQIEFDSIVGVQLSLNDCRVYGTQNLSIAVCLKSDNDSMITGFLKLLPTVNGRMESLPRRTLGVFD